MDRLRSRMLPFYRAWLSIRRLEVPTIAAVNGAAIGAGLCLALACDIRYAADGAKLGVPFNKLGMHAGMAGTWLLPNVVGPAHARDLLLTGRVVEADEALRLGLVSRVIDSGSFLDEVLETAAGIAATAPIAARLTKIALADGGHADFESALQWEALAQPMTLATADLQEGIAAAREKRSAAVPRTLTAREPRQRGRRRGPAASDACLPQLASRSRGALLAATLGPATRAVNGLVSTPVDRPVETVCTAARRGWTKRTACGEDPVRDTPGASAVLCG